MPSAAIALLRPQPVGLHPYAAGLLLLPDIDGGEAHARIMRGALATVALPEAWEFWGRAVAGDTVVVDATAADAGADPVARYNAFVLAPAGTDWRALRQELPEPLASFVGVAAFVLGVSDERPDATPALDGELLGATCLARAAWHLERSDAEGAVRALEDGVDAATSASPVLAAAILGQLATLRGAPAASMADLRRALALSETSELPELRAGLWTSLGMLLQEHGGSGRAALGEAVRAYQEAIHAGFDAERRPDMFGLLQNNIGLAHLSTPMIEASDRLRAAVAVQSFREAARMYTRESNPDMWTTTRLNLANALQYAPSSHPGENLAQAVEIYDELLAVRDRESDPLGYARLLANQANALAHLGGLAPALERFRTARHIALQHDELALADTLAEQIERVDSRRAEVAAAPTTVGANTGADA